MYRRRITGLEKPLELVSCEFYLFILKVHDADRPRS